MVRDLFIFFLAIEVKENGTSPAVAGIIRPAKSAWARYALPTLQLAVGLRRFASNPTYGYFEPDQAPALHNINAARPALRGFIAQRPVTEGSEVERHVMPWYRR